MHRPSPRLSLAFAAAVLLLASPVSADPRPREVMNTAEIRLALKKLGVLGSALYVAAHPDDENTALLSYLSKGRLVRTAYLSITRGDGGQNLIGSDTGEKLGVIRTQELLEARRIDGAEQRFTRAIDFGYSKRAEETLDKWGHERILADVVWSIRRMRPDVIITRFPPDSTAGHGHHAASAILAAEAFRAAADSARFPEQLQWVRPWQAKRLVWNVFRFGAQGPDTNRNRVSVDLGAYNAELGRSYTELAGESRSMHKSQGFGSSERRGSFTNTFILRDGDPMRHDVFDGIDLSWERVPRGSLVTPLVAQALREFNPDRPEASLPVLLRIHGVLAAMGNDLLIQQKRAEVAELIRSCAGLWLEATSATASVSPGAPLRIATSVLARNPNALEYERIEVIRPGLNPVVVERRDGGFRPLPLNSALADTFRINAPLDLDMAQPYWLRYAPTGAWTEVADPVLIGTPENQAALAVRFWLGAAGEHFQITLPVVHRWVDPVAGERYRALDVVPAATVAIDQGVYLFPSRVAREVDVTVRSGDAEVAGDLKLELPEGWTASPASIPVRCAPGRADTLVRFKVTPPAAASTGTLHAFIESEFGQRLNRQRITLDYPHISLQTLLPVAEARLIRTDLAIRGKSVGYVMGSGDQVPEALRQMGFQVTLVSDEDLDRGDLSRYETVVVGVRAYNTRPRLLAGQKRLLDWVEKGGRLVVQYQTNDNALQDKLGPYPFRISRDRVTVEEAPVTVLKPALPLMNTPNRIGAGDFSGWVQERGLYFANPFDKAYETPLSSRDPGEPERNGGLIVARHGRGTFIYTGYAWFRQLPAGVPGAWRLFANLVSTGS
jgi:LmbE family N-acetylglucosaminyl deacetylase